MKSIALSAPFAGAAFLPEGHVEYLSTASLTDGRQPLDD